MEKKIYKLEFTEASFNELVDHQKKLIELAKKVTEQAYAPYSNFRVGAAVLLENNEIITGTNQENSAYPSGLCAERVAIFYANHFYPTTPIKAIAIAAFNNGDFLNEPITPCGSCRQVMIETQNRFKKPFEILLYSKNKILIFETIEALLPFSFNENFLK